MPDEERIEQLELEVKVLRANNKGLKDKIDEQSKEIEELKEDRKSYAEEYIHNNPWLYKQLNENYILKTEAEQKEKEANNEGYFQGRRDERDETDDKIKAKIEEYEKEIQIRKNVINNDVLNKQTIEKARIEWTCMEDFIYEMQSLLEKE